MAGLDPSELDVLKQVARTPDEVAAQVEAVQLAALRNMTSREGAIERGARAGADEADRRNETGGLKDERVRRAQAYAAWEYDGKPSGGTHLREFGINPSTLSSTPDWSGTDWKKGK